MRKLLVLVAVLAVGVVAAVAYAQSVTNTYAVQAVVSPAKVGTSKKPTPVGLKFNYQVGEVNGNRPSPVTKYSILFKGGQVNTNVFPKCSQKQLQASGGKSKCSKAAVGSGSVVNNTGAANNPADKSITCNLALTVYNSGNNKGLLLLEGGPGQGGNKECPIEFGTSNGVIPTNYVRKNGGTALEFTVPDSLLHPAPGLDNSVVDTKSSIKKLTKTVKIKGKKRKVGYYESIGGCTGNKGTVLVSFTGENGQTQQATGNFPCKK
jgi:hypothetical protein